MEPSEDPGRPWAASVGLVLLGLVLATFANVLALSSGQAPAVRALGALGYGGGVFVSGVGIHRLIWFGPPRRTRWIRLLVTAAVTPPVFAASGVVVGILLTVLQARFAS